MIWKLYFYVLISRFLFIKAEFHLLHTVFNGDFLQVCTGRSPFLFFCYQSVKGQNSKCICDCVCKKLKRKKKVTYLTTKLSITCLDLMVLFVIKDAHKRITVDFSNQPQRLKKCCCLSDCEDVFAWDVFIYPHLF